MYHKRRITVLTHFCRGLLKLLGGTTSKETYIWFSHTFSLQTIFYTQVAAKPEVEEMLKSWEISETEQLLVRLQEVREKRQAQENQLRQTEEDK